MPITETGYRSHFRQPGTIEAHGGNVIGQVMAWLDEEAANPAWRAHVDASRQLRLFRRCRDVSRIVERAAIPQISLHKTYTGKNR